MEQPPPMRSMAGVGYEMVVGTLECSCKKYLSKTNWGRG